MKFTEISIGLSRKLSDGNYGSSEYHVGATVSIDGDSPNDAFDSLKRYLTQKLGEMIK